MSDVRSSRTWVVQNQSSPRSRQKVSGLSSPVRRKSYMEMRAAFKSGVSIDYGVPERWCCCKEIYVKPYKARDVGYSDR